MVPPWVIVRPEVADAEGLAEVKRAVEDETYRSYGTAEEHAASLSVYTSADYVRRMILEQDVLAARGPDGQWIGMVALRQQPPVLFLHSLYCLRRGEGLGRALVRAAVQQQAPRPCETVTCEVFVDNEGAIRFFEDLGFARTHVRRPSASYQGRSLEEMCASLDELRARVAP